MVWWAWRAKIPFPQKIQQRVIKALAFKRHTHVYQSSDKRNIKNSVKKKMPSDIEMAWTWLVDSIIKLGVLFPKKKTKLIYCKSISDVLFCFQRCSILCWHISFRNREFNWRNYFVVNPGRVKPIEDHYINKCNGHGSGFALLMYNAHHLQQYDSDIKRLCKEKTCRRILKMEPFLKKSDLDGLKTSNGDCTCCDVWQERCLCQNCTLLHLRNCLGGMQIQNTILKILIILKIFSILI